MIRTTALRLLALTLLACAPQLDAQDTAALRSSADAAFEAADWQAATAALRKLTARAPEDWDAWYRLGYALHATGEPDAALAAHAKGTRSKRFGPTATFNIACVHALQGRKEQAFTWLDNAVRAGFVNWQHAQTDADLGSLREDPRFAKVLEAMRAKADADRRVVAVLVHEGVELLDLAGPGEVFADARSADGEVFRVVTVAGSKEPIVSQRFLKIVPEFTFEDCPRPAVVVLPGGATTRALRDARLVPWVKKVAAEAEVVMSVCTGALILGEAGLLDGVESTTHYGALDLLRKKVPSTKVRRDLRIVDNGRIVTTAGISAGIDGALHVVARLFGEESARQCARYMEYRWVRDHYRGTQPRPKVDVDKGKEKDGKRVW